MYVTVMCACVYVTVMCVCFVTLAQSSLISINSDVGIHTPIHRLSITSFICEKDSSSSLIKLFHFSCVCVVGKCECGVCGEVVSGEKWSRLVCGNP